MCRSATGQDLSAFGRQVNCLSQASAFGRQVNCFSQASAFGRQVNCFSRASAPCIALQSMVLRLVFLVCSFLHVCTAPRAVASQRLDLKLLEEILEPLGRGGSATKVGRLCKAISEGTRQAHESIQELALLRGDGDVSQFERGLHRWVSKQPFGDWLPSP